MKRIIISGGGTGGHIYPAITIYKEIMKQNPDAQVLYVGTERGLEATLVPKEGIEFTTLPVQGLQRKLSFGTLVTLGKTAFSLVKANTIISNFKPDVVRKNDGQHHIKNMLGHFKKTLLPLLINLPECREQRCV